MWLAHLCSTALHRLHSKGHVTSNAYSSSHAVDNIQRNFERTTPIRADFVGNIFNNITNRSHNQRRRSYVCSAFAEFKTKNRIFTESAEICNPFVCRLHFRILYQSRIGKCSINSNQFFIKFTFITTSTIESFQKSLSLKYFSIIINQRFFLQSYEWI